MYKAATGEPKEKRKGTTVENSPSSSSTKITCFKDINDLNQKCIRTSTDNIGEWPQTAGRRQAPPGIDTAGRIPTSKEHVLTYKKKKIKIDNMGEKDTGEMNCYFKLYALCANSVHKRPRVEYATEKG